MMPTTPLVFNTVIRMVLKDAVVTLQMKGIMSARSKGYKAKSMRTFDQQPAGIFAPVGSFGVGIMHKVSASLRD